jgi:uncharacterized glyoxalase superfamily protein PhnB
MTDPLDALRAGLEPVDPEPSFAARLRERLRRALLDTTGGTMTTTETAAAQETGWGPSLIPYIIVPDGRAAMAWYVRVLGARRRGEPYVMDDGSIGHAELAIGNAMLMLAESTDTVPVAAPSGGPHSHSLHLEVSDVDGMTQLAVTEGAQLERPPADQPYGRGATIVDPFGHRWMLLQTPPREPRPENTGNVGYITMVVPDDDLAREFYGAVLGHQYTEGRSPGSWNVPGVQPMMGLRGDPDALPGARLVFQVSDMDGALDAVRAAGGQAGPAQNQGYGILAECQDNQGIPFSLVKLR